MEECQSALLRNLCEVFVSCCNCKGHGERDTLSRTHSQGEYNLFVIRMNGYGKINLPATSAIWIIDTLFCSCPRIKLTFLPANGEKTQSYIRLLSWNQADTTSSNANQAFTSVEIKASLPGGEMYHHHQPRSHLLGFLHNKREKCQIFAGVELGSKK